MKQEDVLAVIYAACLGAVLNKQRTTEQRMTYDQMHDEAMEDAIDFCGRFLFDVTESLDATLVVRTNKEIEREQKNGTN